MTLWYFWQYNAYFSKPCIIICEKWVVLLPIRSLYRHLADAITFLYSLATMLFIVYTYWHQEYTGQIQI